MEVMAKFSPAGIVEAASWEMQLEQRGIGPRELEQEACDLLRKAAAHFSEDCSPDSSSSEENAFEISVVSPDWIDDKLTAAFAQQRAFLASRGLTPALRISAASGSILSCHMGPKMTDGSEERASLGKLLPDSLFKIYRVLSFLWNMIASSKFLFVEVQIRTKQRYELNDVVGGEGIEYSADYSERSRKNALRILGRQVHADDAEERFERELRTQNGGVVPDVHAMQVS